MFGCKGHDVWAQKPDIYRGIRSSRVTGSILLQESILFLPQCATERRVVNNENLLGFFPSYGQITTFFSLHFYHRGDLSLYCNLTLYNNILLLSLFSGLFHLEIRFEPGTVFTASSDKLPHSCHQISLLLS